MDKHRERRRQALAVAVLGVLGFLATWAAGAAQEAAVVCVVAALGGALFAAREHALVRTEDVRPPAHRDVA